MSKIVSNDLKKINYFLVPVAIMIALLGLIGPGFWKINSPNFFSHSLFDENSYKVFKALDLNSLKLDQKYANKSILTKDLFGKKMAIAWSEQVIRKIKLNKELPRIFFSQLPHDLGTYNLKHRKNIFITLILPLLLKGNENIKNEKKTINKYLNNKNFQKLRPYCIKYKIQEKYCTKNNFIYVKKQFTLKVDVLPISMMLAQAAIESGWGLSRFAKEGNALFGQWTWSKNSGLKPEKKPNANFYVKSFKNLQSSVDSYLLNLNTHIAYKKMRNFRYLIKIRNKEFKGIHFAKYLDRYAEIGYEYVKKVTKLIKINKFEEYNKIKFEQKV